MTRPGGDQLETAPRPATRVAGRRGGGAVGLRFAATFGVTSVVLLGIYYFPYTDGSAMRAWVDGFLHRYAASAGFVLGLFEPQVRVVGSSIVGRYSLHIVKTCDAMDVTILLTSAIAAWPCPWKRRVLAAGLGVALIFVLNVLRICSLYYVGIYCPGFFEVAHLDVWPALILIVVLGFFLAVIAWQRPAPAEDVA